jgi:hypothetical protein
VLNDPCAGIDRVGGSVGGGVGDGTGVGDAVGARVDVWAEIIDCVDPAQPVSANSASTQTEGPLVKSQDVV